MKLLPILTVLFVFASALDAKCQARKKKKGSERPAAGYTTAPTTLMPGTSSEQMAPKQTRRKKSSGRVTYDQQQEYYDRVVAVAKAREKTARIMEKPQYSDPMYFGHKRKPKKRPPHKMKLCKECGIRH